MERSEWFDDDDESSPQTPPEDRVWRHPSELGSHGPYGAPPRRRHGLRFAGALALGSAGTLAFAVLTSMHLFGGDLDRAGGFGVAEGSSLFRITAPTSLVRRGTTAVAPTRVATTETTTPVVTGRTVASMPPKVGIRVSGADNTVPAVIDDDGFILAGTDDLAGAREAEVVLDDGTRVAATVESVDGSSGVTRLKPASKVPVPANQTMAWLGVTCSDDTIGAPPLGTTTTTTTAVRAQTAATSVAPPTTGAVRGDASTVSLVSTAPAPSTTSPTTTSLRATAAPTTVADRSAARPTDVTPATTADERPRVVATSVPPSTVAGASTASTTPAPTATSVSASVVVGVRVHHVHEDSPAAVAGVREGDMIVAVDQRAVRSRWALVLAVRRHAIGDRIVVEVVRDGAPLTFDVALTAGPTA